MQDPGTKEISLRHQVRVELAELTGGHGGRVRLRVVDEDLVDRLLLSGKISLKEHDQAGDLLALFRALPGIKAADMEQSGHGGPASRTYVNDHFIKLSTFLADVKAALGVEIAGGIVNFLSNAHETRPDPSRIEGFRAGLVVYEMFIGRWRGREAR